jgi:hypothetical protein
MDSGLPLWGCFHHVKPINAMRNTKCFAETLANQVLTNNLAMQTWAVAKSDCIHPISMGTNPLKRHTLKTGETNLHL